MVRQTERDARAPSFTYPKTFRARQITANGTKLYVRLRYGPFSISGGGWRTTR
jgi:hypothetical protein